MNNVEDIYRKYNPMSEPASFANIAFDTGVIAERQRIIKLLEEQDSVSADWAIALIKGEESGSPLCGCGCGDLYGEQNHE